MTPRPLALVLLRLALVGLLPLLLLSLGLGAMYVSTAQSQMAAAAERRLGNYAAQVDTFLDARIRALQMLADSPLADDPARWEDLYGVAQAFHSSFDSHVIFADADSQMLFNTRTPFGSALPRLPEAQNGRSAAPVALETGLPAVGDIVIGPVIDKPLVAIVVPGVRDGAVRHLMLVTTTLGELTRRVAAFPLERGWVLRVEDSAGDLIAQQAPEGHDPARDVAPEWRFETQTRHAPWRVVVEVPRSVVRQPAVESGFGLLLAILMTTGASVLVVKRASQRIGEQAEALADLDADFAASDIVEFDHARRLLDDNLEQLRKLSKALEQSPGAVLVTDLAGCIEYANPACIASSGYNREELIGQNPRLLASGKTPRETYEAMWRKLSQGEPWQGEFVNRRKDGREYVEFAIISPLREADGSILHYVAVKEDITEKKRTGEELDAYRHRLEEMVEQRTAELEAARIEAEAANHAKSVFVANMSHEIRTPMNAIIGLAHILRQDVVTPAEADRLDKIESAGRHLLAILNDILDLSKVEAGRLVLEEADFHLSVVLDSVGSIISSSARDKGLKIAIDRDDVPLWLKGDPTRLRQAMLNYASNAVKFTERGSVTLRAKLLSEEGDVLLIRFEVEDTGPGVAARDRERLFEVFEQGDHSTTGKYGGTGLGLTITKRLVELMGGEVGVDSTLGDGSTFWFTARLRRGKAELALDLHGAEHAEGALRQMHAGARILVVEDNAVNREVALSLLHRAGLFGDTAANGREAVNKAAAAIYDLALMDMQMPVLNGLDATRRIRALPGWADKPIIAMSANAFAEDKQACLDAGMNAFIAKPVDPPLLYSTLHKWLSVSGHVGGECGALPTPSMERSEPHLAEDAGVSDCMARLRNLEGLDVQLGLDVLGGSEGKYIDLLTLFTDRKSSEVRELIASLKAGDVEGAIKHAHSIKGSAVTLGANKIAALTLELEQGLRRASDAETEAQLSLAESIEGNIATLSTIMRSRTKSSRYQPVATTSSAKMDAVIDELDRLLGWGDTDAIPLFDAHEQAIRAVSEVLGGKLAAQIRRFDFPYARETLRELRSVSG